MDTIESRPEKRLNPEVRFEESDADPRIVVFSGVGILFGTWIALAVLYFFFIFLARRFPTEASGRVMQSVDGLLPKSQPRLEISPSGDLHALQAYEDDQLKNYHWVDQASGKVSLPIERALEITAQRGIPAQTASPELHLYPPQAGSRRTGFEGKVEPEPR